MTAIYDFKQGPWRLGILLLSLGVFSAAACNLPKTQESDEDLSAQRESLRADIRRMLAEKKALERDLLNANATLQHAESLTLHVRKLEQKRTNLAAEVDRLLTTQTELIERSGPAIPNAFKVTVGTPIELDDTYVTSMTLGVDGAKATAAVVYKNPSDRLEFKPILKIELYNDRGCLVGEVFDRWAFDTVRPKSTYAYVADGFVFSEDISWARVTEAGRTILPKTQ